MSLIQNSGPVGDALLYISHPHQCFQLCGTLAAELGPSGVRVNAIGPGVVNTPLTAPIVANRDWYAAYAKKSALGRWAKPHEMAGPIVYLAFAAASFVTGTLTLVDAGWTAVDGLFTPPL